MKELLEMKRIKTFPQITAHSGTVLHHDGRRTFHIKLQTLVRKLGDDGKYYEWPIILRRSVELTNDSVTEEQKIQCIKDAYSEMSITGYAIIVSGIVNKDIKHLPEGDDFFIEWRAHPHTLSEKERIDYLMNHKY
jgi:hypothetical protein